MSELAILAAWLGIVLALYPVYLARRDWFEARGLRVYPLVIVYRRGLRLERISPSSRVARPLRYLYTLGILVLAYNALIFYTFIIAVTSARLSGAVKGPAVTPIIPGVTVSLDTFLYMLPGLAAAVIVHEASHAVAARVEGIPVRSTGLALVAGVLPVAFVEPDKSVYEKAKLISKLRILSAGVLANVIVAFVALSLAPLAPGEPLIKVIAVEPGSPAAQAGIQPGDIILYVNGTRVTSFEELRELIQVSSTVNITVQRGSRLISLLVHPTGNETAKRIGVVAAVQLPPLRSMLYWASLLNHWLAVLNAAPLIVTDGGQALTETLRRIAREQGVAISMAVQVVTLALLALNAGIARIG